MTDEKDTRIAALEAGLAATKDALRIALLTCFDERKRADAAEATLAKVATLHVKAEHPAENGREWCHGDGRTWPCPTITALAPAGHPTDAEDTNEEACRECGDVHRGDGKPQRNCCDWSSADHMCACCKADAFPASPASDLRDADDGFCDECGVTLDLHDGEDTCESAEMKARLLEAFGRIGGQR